MALPEFVRHRTPRELARRVIAWHGIAEDTVFSPCRERPVVAARWDAVVAVATTFPRLSLPKLGQIFGRDESTILYALRKRGVR
ncbi:MAG: helix-turn-helix domain-containing protein [Hyphomicrobiales bacterium]